MGKRSIQKQNFPLFARLFTQKLSHFQTFGFSVFFFSPIYFSLSNRIFSFFSFVVLFFFFQEFFLSNYLSTSCNNFEFAFLACLSSQYSSNVIFDEAEGAVSELFSELLFSSEFFWCEFSAEAEALVASSSFESEKRKNSKKKMRT